MRILPFRLVKSSFKRKTFTEHFKDLKKLIVVAILLYIVILAVVIYYIKDIYQLLENSLLVVMQEYNLPEKFLITSVTELFSVYMTLAFITSFIIFLPILLIYLYFYLYSVINKLQRRIYLLLLLMIPLLFTLGVIIVYFVSLNVIWHFFLDFSLTNQDIILLPKVSEYITFVMKMMLAFGIAFELPVIIIVLRLLELITLKDIIKFSKYAVLLAFIIGAILTPPDPFSQILLALMLLILYFSSYVILRYLLHCTD